MHNHIDAVLTPEQRTAIDSAFQTRRDNLSFLVSLSPEGQQELCTSGTESIAFVRGATRQRPPSAIVGLPNGRGGA